MEPPEDLLGWEDTRWGMSTAELDAVISRKGAQTTERTAFQPIYGKDDLPRYSERMLFAPIGGYSFMVLFLMADATDRLSQVWVTHHSTHQLAELVRKECEKKFGQPNEKGTQLEQCEWVFPTTTIGLGNLPGGPDNQGRVTLRYYPTPDAPKPPRDLDTLLAELDGLVGLAAAKNDIRSLINLVRVRKMRQKQGLRIPESSMDLIFAGNPGTGKTTVARLLAEFYACLGILRRGHLVEVDRSGLVAGYVGQTAIKTAEVIQRALDGVLFIDKAYSLAEEGAQDYGHEAIATLLKSMEDNRSRLIVIAAGYTEKMELFINSNPGLKSRFTQIVRFEDYTGEEMLLIADRMASQNGLVIEPAAQVALGVFLYHMSNEAASFGNARGVRKIFEATIGEQANRVVTMASPSREDLLKITVADVNSAIRHW